MYGPTEKMITSSTTVFGVRKSVDGGVTWEDMEYVNPPMVAGVEYRTTERWNGKPVYTKLIDFGLSANSAQITFSGATMILRHSGNVGGYATPYANGGDLKNAWSAHFAVARTVATLYCGSEMVGLQTYLQIWYTKD